VHGGDRSEAAISQLFDASQDARAELDTATAYAKSRGINPKHMSDKAVVALHYWGPRVSFDAQTSAEAAEVREVLEDLSRLPPSVAAKLHKVGITFRVSPRGMSVEGAEGSYDWTKKVVHIGSRDTNHANVALHEVGHAIGHEFKAPDGRSLHYSEEVKRAHVRMFDSLRPHMRIDGPGSPRGQREIFAEGVSTVLYQAKNDSGLDEEFLAFVRAQVTK